MPDNILGDVTNVPSSCSKRKAPDGRDSGSSRRKRQRVGEPQLVLRRIARMFRPTGAPTLGFIQDQDRWKLQQRIRHLPLSGPLTGFGIAGPYVPRHYVAPRQLRLQPQLQPGTADARPFLRNSQTSLTARALAAAMSDAHAGTLMPAVAPATSSARQAGLADGASHASRGAPAPPLPSAALALGFVHDGLTSHAKSFVQPAGQRATLAPADPQRHSLSHKERVERRLHQKKVDEQVRTLHALSLSASARSEALSVEVAARLRDEHELRARLSSLLSAAEERARNFETERDGVREAIEGARRESARLSARVDELLDGAESLASMRAAGGAAGGESVAEGGVLRAEAATLQATLKALDERVRALDELIDAPGQLREQAWGDDSESELLAKKLVPDVLEQIARLKRGSERHAHDRRALIELVAATCAAVGRVSLSLEPSAAPRPPGTRAVALRALTPGELAAVAAALGGGDAREKLAEFENIPVTRADMASLKGLNWLNDEVINYFLKLLEMRSSKLQGEDDVPQVHFMNTQFYLKLTGVNSNAYNYAGVRRWTRKVDIFEKDLVLVPIHCHGNHWALALINLRQERFEYLDSLFGSAGGVLRHLRQYLQDESQDKRKMTLDLSRWVDVEYKEGIPRQRNGSDCGVFMCTNANYISRGARLNYSQEDMPYMRKRMVLEILNAQLLDL
mmetsp:Transcript_4108/g.8852  ORF Transcript_4108/g.8852 Transcript_4108/m.8852 type:complete len:685 (+) Transcript_4108:229-2283(+)